jgi:uncharacterized repeat protein (TIGR01451 family)
MDNLPDLSALSLYQKSPTLTIMKTILLIIFVAFEATVIKAQQNAFQTTYPVSSICLAMDICQTADGGYLLASTQKSIVDSSRVEELHPVFIKTDSLGNTAWMKNSSLNFCPVNICKTADGGYLVLGGRYCEKLKSRLNTGGLLLKLNSNGDTVWTKPVTGSSICWSASMKTFLFQASDGGFFMVACNIQNLNQLIFYKLSKDGIPLLSDTLVLSNQQQSFNVQLANDGGALIALANSTGAELQKRNLDGSIAWTKAVSLPNAPVDELAFCQTSDGGYLLRTGLNSNPSARLLTRLNSNTDTLWNHTCFSKNASLQFGNVCQTADKGFVFFCSSDATSPASSIEKTDSNGVIMWEQTFHHNLNSIDFQYSGMITRDNGFALCGYTSPGQNPYSSKSVFFTKTTSEGVWANTISGNVFLDANRNCIHDSSEIYLPNQQVKLTPGPLYATTDSSGNYLFQVPKGTYTVSLVAGKYTAVSCPASGNYTVQFNSLGGSSILNFADSALASCPDLNVSLGTCGLSSCFQNTYTVCYSNQGMVTDSNATVTLTPDAGIIFMQSSIPWTFTAPNSYTFQIGHLAPGQRGHFRVTDSVSCTAVVGSNLCVQARIFSTMLECDTLNNKATDCHTITSSHDPNELQVSSGNNTHSFMGMNNQITPSDTLSYFIRFENTGTSAAVNIVVTDTLSTSLDPTTLNMGTSSDPYTYTLNDKGILTLQFQNIMLPDSAHNSQGSTGFVRFSIAQKHNNLPGITIKNRASIVFDFNKPVATNSTSSFIPLITSIQTKESTENGLTIFPNPSHGDNLMMSLTGEEAGKKVLVVLYDMEGKTSYSKVIMTGQNNGTLEAIDPAHQLAPGVYLIVATSENKIYKQRIIIE